MGNQQLIFFQVKSVIDNAGKLSTDQQSKKKKTQMQEDFQVQLYLLNLLSLLYSRD